MVKPLYYPEASVLKRSESIDDMVGNDPILLIKSTSPKQGRPTLSLDVPKPVEVSRPKKITPRVIHTKSVGHLPVLDAIDVQDNGLKKVTPISVAKIMRKRIAIPV
jgi:hypothetical protein